ncbi:hypothetical protein NIT60_11380 [Mammaliicoccus sciuri]|nr:hypothetical protein NIT60_11380 [Mammaliicoccus sciuri]
MILNLCLTKRKLSQTKDTKKANAYYSQGLTNLYDAVWDEVAKSYGYDGKKFTEDEPQSSGLGKIPFIIFIIFIIVFFIIYFKNGGGRPPRGGNRRGTRRGMTGPFIFGGSSGSSGGGFSGGGLRRRRRLLWRRRRKRILVCNMYIEKACNSIWVACFFIIWSLCIYNSRYDYKSRLKC